MVDEMVDDEIRCENINYLILPPLLISNPSISSSGKR